MDRASIPFALPDVGEDEIEAVVEAIRSGWVTSGGRMREFEEAFASALGGEVHAVAVNSATAGLHLALESMGIQPGDEVIVPTWTFTATAEVVRYLGGHPVIVDVEPETLCIDLEQASKSVSERTKAIMPVHFAGHAIPPDALADWSRVHDVPVLEDAAHAFPSSHRDVQVGRGDSRAVVFSFYATKTMTTGEGGMVVTRDRELAERVRVLRLHGIDRDAFGRYRSDVPAWEYDVVAPGYKYNLTDPAAAMGLVQLGRAESMRARREEISELYREGFADLPLTLPPRAAEGDVHAWHLFVVRVRDEAPVDRDGFISALAGAGIGTSVHFIPLHRLSYWRDTYALCSSDFPVAERIFPTVASLPIYSSMTPSDVHRVIETVRAALS